MTLRRMSVSGFPVGVSFRLAKKILRQNTQNMSKKKDWQSE